MNSWGLALAFIPVAWLLQNTIHEASHLLVGWLVEGRKPLGLWPYPHKYKGRFYFARAQSGPATKDGSPRYRYIAPAVAGLIGLWLFTSAAALFKLPFLIVLGVTSLIDILWFWRGYFWGTPKCDGKRYRKEIGR